MGEKSVLKLLKAIRELTPGEKEYLLWELMWEERRLPPYLLSGKTTLTGEDIYQTAARMTPEKLEELIEQLRMMREKPARSILDDIPVLDVGPWPENLSLRRKDMYGDDER